MSERRRHLLVLLIVLGLLAGSVAVLVTHSTKLGLDLQGGVRLVYQGKPTKDTKVTAESLQRALDIMRERVDAFGVSEPELARTGEDQIEVNLPGVEDAERAAQQVGSTAQLFFYDWEKNVLDENCKTNETEINGGQQPVTGLYNAVKRASKCEIAVPKDSQAAAAPRFYAFDKVSKKPFNNGLPDESKEAALEGLDDAEKARRRSSRSSPACSSCATRSPTPTAPDPDAFWIIRDDPGLSGTDIKNPEQNFDQRGGNEPIVTFDFSDKGQKAFQSITSQVAQRGADNANPLNPDPESSSHHFAIALDNELVSIPFINFRENPDGIDGSTGAQISGGFTITSAQDLAKVLKTGALPLKLDLISRSQVSATLGKQALNQGLKAGIAGFIDRRDLPARLLPRARRHRDRRAGHLRPLLLRDHQADPGHADAAGDRGPDPHTGGGGRRQHRDLRTREGRGARREIRGRRALPRATRRASRRSSTPTSSRCSSRSSCSSSPRRGSRASPSCSGSGRCCRCSRRCSRPRRSSSACATRRSSAASPRSAPGTRSARSPSTSWARRSGSSRSPA